ncbi:MAG: GNAT family N-acetyltransferase [Cyanobacteria bacterium P01_A01_bin.84]
MDVQIRLSKSEDLEKMLEIQASSLRNLSPSYDSEQIESLVRSQTSARLAPGVVAEYKGEIIGFASWMSLIPFTNLMPQIAGIYVHPDFARQGVGTQMLKSIEKIAIDRGNEVMRVMSSMDAVSFYQGAGYELISESKFPSEGKIWIPCKYLSKRLVFVTKTQRLCRLVKSFYSGLKSVISFILFDFVVYFIIGLLVSIATSVIGSLFW